MGWKDGRRSSERGLFLRRASSLKSLFLSEAAGSLFCSTLLVEALYPLDFPLFLSEDFFLVVFLRLLNEAASPIVLSALLKRFGG